MIKKIFLKIIYFPFLFPFFYQIKLPLKNLGSFNLLDFILLISIFLGLFLIYQEKNWQDFKKYFWADYLLKSITLFLIIGIFFSIYNSNQNFFRNLGLLKSYFLLPILFTAIVKFFLNKKYFTIWGFLLIYVFYSFFLGFFSIFFWIIKKTTFDNRVSLFFDSPNQLSIALSLGIISTTILYFYKKSSKKLFFLSISTLIIALFLTQSIGSLIAGFFVFLIITIKFLNNNLVLIFKTVLCSSILLIFLLFNLDPLLKKIGHDPFLNRNSSDSRLVIYLATQKIISNNFLEGIGPANFQEKYLEQQSNFPPYPQWAVPHSHNSFLQIWLSFGFFSFLIWIYLLQKKVVSFRKPTLIKKISLYFLLYFLIHGLVDVPFWNNDQALFFWFMFIL